MLFKKKHFGSKTSLNFDKQEIFIYIQSSKSTIHRIITGNVGGWIRRCDLVISMIYAPAWPSSSGPSGQSYDFGELGDVSAVITEDPF